jgi:hypothetical protein
MSKSNDTSPTPVFAFADELQSSGQHCATIARAKAQDLFLRGFVPEVDDPTATVTFIFFEGKTYAVTAGHVIDVFKAAAIEDGCDPEGYFVPVAPGVPIGPPFVRPPGNWPTPDPDIALRPIDPDLPARIGKKAFGLVTGVNPEFPVPYALAVGFPTAAKEKRKDPQGERLALIGVQAAAEGVGSPDSDQVQFWSEIPDRPLISQLSGMSGGPVFWSDGTAFGLLGFVKEALDVEPAPGVETLHAGPKVNFICQRASYETFAVWAEFADREFLRQRALLNERIAKGA